MLLKNPQTKFYSLLGAFALAGIVHADEPVTPPIPGVAAGGVVIELIKSGFKGTEGSIGFSDGSLLFTLDVQVFKNWKIALNLVR